MKTLKTSDEKLVYIGTKGGEEYYLNLGDDDVRGWSFMGLRPQTEEKLREYTRENDPAEMLGLSRQEFENISNYFDYEKFADDMEDDWLERFDSQAERENEEGETLYLGFGSGQSIFNYFKEHGINNYDSYTSHFEEVGLDESKFNAIIKIIKNAKDDSFKMTDEEKASEKKLFVDLFLNAK